MAGKLGPVAAIAIAGITVGAFVCSGAQAAGTAHRPAHDAKNQVIVVNQSALQINGLNLTPHPRRPGGPSIVRSDHFIYKADGEDRHSAWLFTGLTGRVVFQAGFSLRPQCVFDVSIALARGASFYRGQQNLCREPRIVVTDAEVRIPLAAQIAAAPEPETQRRAGAARSRRAPTDFVEYYYNSGANTHFYYSPASVRSEDSTREVAWTDSTLQQANHGTERIVFHARIDCAAQTIQSLWTESFSLSGGESLGVTPLYAPPDPYRAGAMGGYLAARVC